MRNTPTAVKMGLIDSLKRGQETPSSQLPPPPSTHTDKLASMVAQYTLSVDTQGQNAYGEKYAVSHYNSIPNTGLPDFHGNSLEFAKWWQTFLYLVDMNPKIPTIMKLSILMKALKGKAEPLTRQIAFAPHSYYLLKQKVIKRFDDTQAALRLLTERMRAYPRVKKNDYDQLSDFAGFAVEYVMHLMQFRNGTTFCPYTTIQDLYGKMDHMLTSEYKKDWTSYERREGKQTDRDQLVWMLEWLDDQVMVAKEYYYSNPKATPTQLGMPPGNGTDSKKKQVPKKNGIQPKDTPKEPTAANLFVDTDHPWEAAFAISTKGGQSNSRGRGKERGGASTRGRGRGTAPTSNVPTQTAAGSGSTPISGKGFKNNVNEQGYDISPCQFCGQHQHFARFCTQNMKPDTVYPKAVEALLCLNCLRNGHFASTCPHETCSVEGCQSRHHKWLHGHNIQPSRKA